MVLTGLTVLAALLAAADEHAAHVHGVAHLGIGMDGSGAIEAELETPGHNVYGFERAPRDAVERRIVEDAHALLLGSGNAVNFNAEAGCRYLGGEFAGDGGYNDLRIVYRFECAAPDRLNRIETGLFGLFDDFEEVEGVFLDPGRQDGFELTPAAPAHRLAR